MNNKVYRKLDDEEIVTKHHYCFDYNGKLVLLPSNHPCIGKKVERRYIYEKISLEDFRILNDNEIITREHFQVQRDSYGYLMIYRYYYCYLGRKAGDVRKENSCNSGYNIYSKNIYAKKTQFNFETLNILKDIQL
jgi:hypothetical protein